MLPPFLVAAALVVGVLALAPTRRLFLAGRSPGLVSGYFIGLWVLGMLLAISPLRARIVLPLLALLYVLPFVAWRAGIGRLLGRRPREVRPPMKNVTPPARDEPPGTR